MVLRAVRSIRICCEPIELIEQAASVDAIDGTTPTREPLIDRRFRRPAGTHQSIDFQTIFRRFSFWNRLMPSNMASSVQSSAAMGGNVIVAKLAQRPLGVH
jgi:hypothetical protein